MPAPPTTSQAPPRPSASGPDPRRAAARVALVVALAHGLNDAYAAFVPPLLPRIMDRLGLSIAMAATLAMAFSIASSLFQPLLGWMADRYGRRAFVVAGPLITGFFVSLIGQAPTFGALLALLLLSGLGSAAFHPPGASYAVRVDEGKGSGLRMSVFSFGGTAGFAVGPLLAVGLVQWRGLEGLWIAMIPVVVLTPLLYRALPSGRAEARRAAHPPPSPLEVMRHLAGPLGLVFGVSALMAYSQRIYVTLEPIIVARAGGSETLGAVALTVYLGAQALGTVAGGWLADRFDRRAVLSTLCGLAVPAHLLAIGLPPGSAPALVAAGCAGFLGMATLPPVVVVAQELIPRGAAVGSGIVMGLAWALGSVGVLGVGALADVVGPRTAALWSLPLALGAVILASRPSLGRGRHPVSA